MTLIDTLAWAAVAMIGAGSYLELGLGWALIVSGGLVMGLAIYAAEKVNNVAPDAKE